jgi:hypothetical protein
MVKRHSEQVDPDPISLFLIILGAVGSAVTLLSYAEEKRRQAEARHAAEGTQALGSLNAAEIALADLRARLESLEIMVASGAGNDWRSAPLKFGGLELKFSSTGVKRWRTLITKTSTASSELQRALTALLAQLAASEYKLSKGLTNRVETLQTQLNAILMRAGSLTFGESIDDLATAVSTAQGVLSALRQELQVIFGEPRGNIA